MVNWLIRGGDQPSRSRFIVQPDLLFYLLHSFTSTQPCKVTHSTQLCCTYVGPLPLTSTATTTNTLPMPQPTHAVHAHLFLMRVSLPTVPCKCHGKEGKGSGGVRRGRMGAGEGEGCRVELTRFKGCLNCITRLNPAQVAFTAGLMLRGCGTTTKNKDSRRRRLVLIHIRKDTLSICSRVCALPCLPAFALSNWEDVLGQNGAAAQ